MGNNIIAKAVLDGWQLSGISTFLSGTYSNFGYNFTGAVPNATTLDRRPRRLARDHRVRPESAAQ